MEQGVTTRHQATGYDWGAVREKLVERTFATTLAFAAGQRNQPILTSLTVPLEVDVEWFQRRIDLLSEGTNQFFWSSPTSPNGHLRLVGYGTAETIIVHGTDRFVQLKKHLRTLQSRWFYTTSDTPKLLGGFAFQPGSRMIPWEGWEDGRFLLPKFLIEADAHQNMALTISYHVSRDADVPDLVEEVMMALQNWFNAAASDVSDMGRKTAVVSTQPDVKQGVWQDIVRFFAGQITAGSLHKVVLARRQTLHWPNPIALKTVLDRLQQSYPESHVFSVCHTFGCFVGASPERLVRVVGGRVSIDALAGTIGRGHTEQEDFELGQRLLASRKDRREHAVVVEWIRKTIQDLVDEVTVPVEPILRKLANVQHLFTPVDGVVKGHYSVVDFVERLHPTPAVAGEPRDAALRLIQDHEQMDRGWYASPVGWLSPSGDGEFTVALRSAVLTGNVGYLFAGAGIMGDSNPNLEWEETELKLQAMRCALEKRAGEDYHG